MPLGFEKVDLTRKLEAAIDLFAPEPKGIVSGQAECVEQLFEETLERIAAGPAATANSPEQGRF